MDKFSRYLPLGLLLLFSGKALIFGSQPVDAAILLILAGLVSYFEFKPENKKLKDMQDQINLLKTGLETNEKLSVDIRSHVNSIKLGQNIRTASFK